MPTIYLIRHAHADWAPSDDRPLSQQGQATAMMLAERLDGRSIGAIYSSPSRRAIDTVAPLAAARRLGLSVVRSTHRNLLALIVNGFDDRFGYAFWQGLTFPDAHAAYFKGDTLLDLQRIWETT